MAARKNAEVETDVEEEVGNELEYAHYLEKEPTTLQVRFVDWIVEKTGIDIEQYDVEMAFSEGVRLGTALRMIYQASDENKAANAERAEQREAEEAEREQRRAEKVEAAEAKRLEKEAAAAEREAAKAAKSDNVRQIKATNAPAKKVQAKKVPANKVADDILPAGRPRPGPRKRAAGSTAPF